MVTILLSLTLANTALSIIMADIEGSLDGFLISTSIIVIFGEIIPQTIGNRFGLILSVRIRFFIYFAYYLLFIITFPIGAILDKVLGEEAGYVLSKH